MQIQKRFVWLKESREDIMRWCTKFALYLSPEMYNKMDVLIPYYLHILLGCKVFTLHIDLLVDL